MDRREQQLTPIRSKWGRRWSAPVCPGPGEVAGAGRPRSLEDAEMIIRVTQSGAVLQGPEQFDSFKVLADGLADVLAVLDRAGARKGPSEVEAASDNPASHVMIDVEWLRREARRSGVGPEWEDGLRSMMKYASTRGWTAPDNTGIRAHVERVP
jgi:hypothetical protein